MYKQCSRRDYKIVICISSDRIFAEKDSQFITFTRASVACGKACFGTIEQKPVVWKIKFVRPTDIRFSARPPPLSLCIRAHRRKNAACDLIPFCLHDGPNLLRR